jgi:hypothetical protein
MLIYHTVLDDGVRVAVWVPGWLGPTFVSASRNLAGMSSLPYTG